jgi:hypothetical protein
MSRNYKASHYAFLYFRLFLPLRWYSTLHHVLTPLNLYVPPLQVEATFHPYIIRGNSTVLYVLKVTFLDKN